MSWFWMAWSAVMAAAAARLAVPMAGEWFAARRAGCVQSRREAFLADLMCAVVAGDEEFPVPRCRDLRSVAEVVAAICTSTSGWDREAMGRLVVRCDLEERILRRAAWSRGWRRARWLALLGRLPLAASTAAAVEPYLGDKNPCVRMCALVVRLVADSASALRTLDRYPYRLTALEVAEILSVLRRGVIPLAWEPLLMSPAANLRRIGMALVRQFSVEEAERHLHTIVAGDDAHLAGEALYTLCLLRRPLCDGECRMVALDAAARRSLMRLLAMEGYSSSALDGVVDFDERSYYTARVESYKRMLA